jgi:hypothetical protein
VQASTASAVKRVLRQLSTVQRQEFVALHLTCAPWPDAPSTSTAALEAAHPELRRIAEHH